MSYEKEIISMYRDIENLGGDFGDGVEFPSFDPWALIDTDTLTEFERKGVYVSILCRLMAAIDNSTYEDVMASGLARQLRRAQRDSLFADMALMQQALMAFQQSEEAFAKSLNPIYRQWVLPEISK